MAAGKLSPAEAESQLKVRRLSLRRGMLLRVVTGSQCRAWSGQETAAETAWQQAVQLTLCHVHKTAGQTFRSNRLLLASICFHAP